MTDIIPAHFYVYQLDTANSDFLQEEKRTLHEIREKSWMRALFAYAESEKKRLALSVVLSVLSVMLGLAPLYCMYRLVCLFVDGSATAAGEIRWCLLSLAAYAVGHLIDAQRVGTAFDTSLIWKCIVLQIVLVFLRFLFDYFRARLQEPISYQLTARDRLAIDDSRKIHLKIEWGYVPGNALHLLALKCGSVGLALSAALQCVRGQMDFSLALMFIFFSFSIFASLEPISDSAHTLGVIDDAMDQLDALRGEQFIDAAGREIALTHYDIAFRNVDFGYDSQQVLKNVSFTIPEQTSTAIVGPSGSITVGGHDLREFTCDVLNISMVFQNVYLFHDTIRANILFGRPDASEEEMIEAAKKARCHEFIMALPDGYDTVVGEGGGTLSGGEKQRISIARAILKNAPIIILDEATASVDPENEHLIQQAISELTRGKTIITIAHRLATIRNADQILVVDDGRIAKRGTHAELVQQDGLYKRFTSIREQAEGWRIAAE